MNRIQIYYWHGRLAPHQQKKLEDMGIYKENDRFYINDISPAEFVEKWQDNVLLLVPSNGREEWLVGVTKHSDFNTK